MKLDNKNNLLIKYPWLKQKVPNGYWNIKDNRFFYITWFKKSLNINMQEDWYEIVGNDLKKNYGDGILKFYNFSLYKALKDLMPEYNWLEWKFKKNPQGFWKSIDNRKAYIIWLGRELGYKKYEDWYKIDGRLINKNCGDGFIKYYNRSIVKALKELIPNYEWYDWKFKKTPQFFWENSINRQNYMAWLEKKIGINTNEDWYKVDYAILSKNYGSGYLKHYNYSVIKGLKEYKPNYHFYEWKMSAPKNFWKSPLNRQRYKDWLQKELGYSSNEDWYKITQLIINENYGGGLLKIYKGSPFIFMKNLVPKYDWKAWKFSHVSAEYWNSKDNRKIYFQWLGKELGYKRYDDWYKISQDLISKNFGGGLLTSRYSASPIKAIKDLMPEFNWLDWKFIVVPQSFWESKKNRNKYINWLGKELGYKKYEDWYNIDTYLFRKNYSGAFLNFYAGSAIKAIKENFPAYDWVDWKFKTVRNNYWNSKKNRTKYLIWLEQKLNYKNNEDWYGLNQSLIVKNYGITFLKYYKSSPVKIVKEYIPNYPWKEWLFNQVPNNFWADRNNHKRYINWLTKELGYRKHEDWYDISANIIYKNNGRGILKYYKGSPMNFVVKSLSTFPWEYEKFSNGRKTQKYLFKILTKIYEPYKVIWEYKFENLKFKNTGAKIGVDIFIPHLNLCVEYQGEQHTLPVKFFGGHVALKKQKLRDIEKKMELNKAKLTLLEVSYTWDRKEKTLRKMIDLLKRI